MYPVKNVWIVLMVKILQTHLLYAFVANLKIDVIYGIIRKGFATKILLSGKFSLFLTLLIFLRLSFLGELKVWLGRLSLEMNNDFIEINMKFFRIQTPTFLTPLL